MNGRTPPPLLALGLLGAPVVIGASVMWLGGASLGRWAGHLAAGAVGLLVYAAAIRAPWFSFKALSVAAVAGALVLAWTLASPGLQGVHRWLLVLGVRLNALSTGI